MNITDEGVQLGQITTLARTKKYKWWQAALVLVLVSIIGGLTSGGSSKARKFYEKKQKQAPWAPPAWLFGPAWTFNNAFLLWGLKRILNTNLQNKNKLLALQGMIWVVFLTFGYVYFRKGSPYSPSYGRKQMQGWQWQAL